MRRKAVIVLVAASFMAAAIVYSQTNVRDKLSAARHATREAVIAVESYFVDDCGGLLPGADNVLPHNLTTPIAYLKPAGLTDPYSDFGERMKYFNRPERANSSFVVVASRGPDGDIDLDRLPDNIQIRPHDTSVTIRMLPQTTATATRTRVVFIEELEQLGIVQYDPTNGAHSDGDVFETNAQ